MTEDYFYLNKIINEHNKNKTLKPGNYGINSTEKKVLKYISNLLDNFGHLSTWNLKEGSQYFDNLKYAIIDFMKLNGYELKINAYDKYYFKRMVKK